MASLDIDRNGLISRSISNEPPKHYTMKIVSFSALKSENKYESGEFKVGGYKWKLVLFPNGNKKYKVDDHISLYLEMGGETPVETGWIVTVDYRLFLLNQQKEKRTYLVLEDTNKKEKKYCFYQTIVGGLAGFDRFISLDDFSNASNGYLINDICEFGAEVCVFKTRRTGKGECVSMNLHTTMCTFVWKIANFSKLPKGFFYSNPISAENQKYCTWRLGLDPKGVRTGSGSHVSIYLEVYKPDTLPTGSKLFVEFTLCILDQIHGKHPPPRKAKIWFTATAPWSSLGYEKFITQKDNAEFLMNDTCIVEFEITILGITIPGISTP